MRNPIPPRLINEFRGYMDAAEQPDLPDGAWFQVMDDAARDFMRRYNLRGDPFDAREQYFRICGRERTCEPPPPSGATP